MFKNKYTMRRKKQGTCCTDTSTEDMQLETCMCAGGEGEGRPRFYFLANEIFMAVVGVILKPWSASLAAADWSSFSNSTKAMSCRPGTSRTCKDTSLLVLTTVVTRVSSPDPHEYGNHIQMTSLDLDLHSRCRFRIWIQQLNIK